ncbi:hypothetical protein EH165_12480 [Nakamurella antarctica]|uniref:Excreted virulence factor EspC, type VII ESX diderm n=1 Tax=Nakamurella antarctica TaxID=1902245 RepID=A0A3G8ZNC5_9ACTN|nr:hypothetical protein [Nakamurella antarctica]AZI58832.1 hypothetical protein EH165_12480 [Nakamurella antarctica]
MAEFFADLGALDVLAGQLSLVQAQLGDAETGFSSFTEALGSSAVADSLMSFCSGWEDGRKTMVEEIGSLYGAIVGVKEDYANTEAQLEAAWSQGSVTTADRPGGEV